MGNWFKRLQQRLRQTNEADDKAPLAMEVSPTPQSDAIINENKVTSKTTLFTQEVSSEAIRHTFINENGGNQPEKTLFTEEQVERYLPVIRSDDGNDIEEARGWVVPADVPPLIAYYWQLEDWQDKRAIVDILQDQYHDDLPAMMLDFLRTPVAEGDEWVELAQAVALGFVDEQYDQFMVYYNDRQRLAHDVKVVLQKHGLQAEPLPSPPPSSSPKLADTIPASSFGDVNQQLLAVAEAGDETAVLQVLADGADINTVYDGDLYEGCSALFMAIVKKQYHIAAHLITHGAEVNLTRPMPHRPDRSRGQTPLWWAANHGHVPTAQQLLTYGARVNLPDHHGSTPLITAASSGHLEMVRFLVENGAEIHAHISDGRKAFNLAITNGHKRVAEYLLSQGNDPNESGHSGYTPLMIAAENNFYDLAKTLIKAGADVNAVHAGRGFYVALRGYTPLVFAVRRGYVRMTRLLIQAGADVHYKVPAAQNSKGEPLPEQSLLDLVHGKRAESMTALLHEAGVGAT